jgi:hypothetical protein
MADTFNTSTGYENVRGGSTETAEELRKRTQLAKDQVASRDTANINVNRDPNKGYGAALADVSLQNPYAGLPEGQQRTPGTVGSSRYLNDGTQVFINDMGPEFDAAYNNSLGYVTNEGSLKERDPYAWQSAGMPASPDELSISYSPDPTQPTLEPGDNDDPYQIHAPGQDPRYAPGEAFNPTYPDSLNALGGGLGGSIPNAGDALAGAQANAGRLRDMGQNVPPPNAADASRQQDALDSAMGFLDGPRATAGAQADLQGIMRQPGQQATALNDVQRARATPGAQAGVLSAAQAATARPGAQAGVMPGVDEFLAGPEGPSAAELQLKQAQDDSMSDALSLARSTRGGAGAKNRAMRVAMAENAATQSGAARDTALLRAKEAEARRAETLAGLGLKGNLAQGIDQRELAGLDIQGGLARGVDQRDLEALGLGAQLSAGMDDRQLRGAGINAELARGLDSDTLSALGLGGDLSTAMRNAGVQERGQSLDFTRGMEQTAAGLEGDVLSAIPQLEQVRHADQYEMTPEQKLRFAREGGIADILAGIFG